MSWLHADLTRPVVAPLQSDASNRDPVRTVLVVAQFAPEHAARYARRDLTGDAKDETFCNFFLRDTSEAMGAPVPQMRANDQVAWLSSEAARQRGWATVSEHAAMGCVSEGMLGVVGWVNRNGGPGHVAVMLPSLEHADSYVAQAGSRNFLWEPMTHGFGDREVTFFVHP